MNFTRFYTCCPKRWIWWSNCFVPPSALKSRLSSRLLRLVMACGVLSSSMASSEGRKRNLVRIQIKRLSISRDASREDRADINCGSSLCAKVIKSFKSLGSAFLPMEAFLWRLFNNSSASNFSERCHVDGMA